MADEATTETAVDESTADSTSDGTGAATDDPKGADALGDAGKKALDAMKADRNKARDDLKSLRDEFDAFRAKAEGKEREHAAAQEAQRVKDEALAAANQRILKAEVRAAAAGKLADPQDALRFLDLSEFEVGSDGEVDGKAVATAITDLISKKPYLAAQGRRFQGDADGGARKDSTPQQLSQDDVKRMYAAKDYEGIEKARAEGRLNTVLGIS